MPSAGENGGAHVGQAVPDVNARRWVEGRGKYLADVERPGSLHACIVRSPHPHAEIVGIDASAARAMPGVKLVVTGEDVAGLQPHGYLWALPGQKVGDGRCLAADRVRHVGEAVAAVVAVDPWTARDAADLVDVTYAPLPAVTTIAEALSEDATILHPEWGDNVQTVAAWPVALPDAPAPPDPGPAIDDAHLVVEERFRSERVFSASMETRGVIAEYDGDQLTVWTSTQSIHQIREAIAQTLGMAEHRIRVVAPDVGGAFGAKAIIYPEEVLVAHLATRLGRPVKWVEDRFESFVATTPSRAQEMTLTVGFDEDGAIVGLRARIHLDVGSAPSACGAGTVWVTGALLPGPYVVPAVDIVATAVVTNKTPLGAFRGYGQPEAVFPLERVLDIAARRLGVGPAELRRRNLVRSEQLPYLTATGLPLDSGDYHRLLDLAEETWAQGGAAPDGDGMLRGEGLAFYAECTNFGPTGTLPLIGVTASGWDSTTVRVEPDGAVRVLTSQTPMGQGVETVLAQTAADAFGLPLERVSVSSGDTLVAPYTGYASGGSRAAGVAGSSVIAATRKAVDKMKAVAAHQLEADPRDLELDHRGFYVKGSPAQAIDFATVARAAYIGGSLPEGLEPGIELTGAFDPPSLAFSYGVVRAGVRVDPRTGQTTVERLLLGHDCGPQLNPGLVAGQIVGGVAQGIGTALYEALEYEDGRPLVRGLNDYLVPGPQEVPDVELVHTETPTPFSLNGAKGVGESGVIAVPAAVVNAIQDALPDGAAELTQIPAWPERVLAVLEDAQQA